MAEFENIVFTPDRLHEVGELNRTEFYSCKFIGIETSHFAAAKGLRMVECTFDRCNLSNLALTEFSFRDVCFESCKLIGLNWSACSVIVNPTFKDCKLDFSSFQSLDLRSFQCLECSVRDVDFSNAELSKADFSGSILMGTSFNGSNLSEADFRKAKNYSIHPLYTKLKGARFSYPDVTTLLSALGVRVEV